MHKVIGLSCLLVFDQALASTDPIAADPSTGAHFNRYAYANNNPYKYTDPDGRAARLVHHAEGIRVEMPATFTGPGATPENIAVVTRGFESQSGVYNVNGTPTSIDFRITEVTKATHRALRNEVRMFDGPTDHENGVSYADRLGGTKVSINVKGLASLMASANTSSTISLAETTLTTWSMASRFPIPCGAATS